jgi:hypothetical protein
MDVHGEDVNAELQLCCTGTYAEYVPAYRVSFYRGQTKRRFNKIAPVLPYNGFYYIRPPLLGEWFR